MAVDVRAWNRAHRSVILVAVSFLILPALARADTIVSGDVSGAWIAANSPYRVADTLVVPAGKTLIIEPGVDVLFDAPVPIFVHGTLDVRGTAADSVHFLPGTSAEWRGILVERDGVLRMSYGRASGARGTRRLNRSGAIRARNATVELRHCVLRGNRAIETGGGIQLLGTTALLDDCAIVGNTDSLFAGGGINAWGGALTLRRCLVAENRGGGIAAGLASVEIVDCIVRDNRKSLTGRYGEGIDVSSGPSRITGCTVVGNVGGISLKGSFGFAQTVISNCVIARNVGEDFAGFEIYGSALAVAGSPMNDVVISHCTISGNRRHAKDEGTLAVIRAASARIMIEGSIIRGNGDDSFALQDAALTALWSDLGTTVGTRRECISADPQFSDTLSYALLPTSPCIGTGSWYWEDAAGNRPDMGVGTGLRLDPDVPRIRATDGEVLTNETRTGFLDIASTGGNTLTVREVRLPAHFSTTTGFPASVPPGGTLRVPIVFDPSAGDLTGTALVAHDDPWQDTARVAVRGTVGLSVTGPVTGTWTRKNSPYRVSGVVYVPEGMSLTIKPGVDVIGEAGSELHSYGDLRVEGTETDSVRFFPAGSAGWGGIWIQSTGVCSLAYARISGARGSSSYGPLYFRGKGDGPLRLQFTDVVASDIRSEGYEHSHNTMSVIGAAGEFVRCTFRDHRTFDGTAGIDLHDSRIVLRDCHISGNRIDGSGQGGISIFRGDMRLENCVIERNTNTRGGAGVLIGDGAASIIQCTIVGNTGTKSSGLSIANVSDSTRVTVHGSIIRGNSPCDLTYRGTATPRLAVEFSNIGKRVNYLTGALENDWPGQGNLNVDPLFVDAAGGDFRLQPGSSVADAGSPYLLDTDGTRAEMGAYGGLGGLAPVPRVALLNQRLAVHERTPESFGIANTGGADLIVTSLAVPPRFIVETSFPQTIPPAGSLTVSIRYAPETSIPTLDTLVVMTNDAYQSPPKLALRGAVGGFTSGTLSGVLAASGSPYRLNGDLTVPADDSLTIEPGVRLYADVDARITVRGHIRAVGTPTDSIVFDRGISERWGGIVVESSGIADLAFCRISGAFSASSPPLSGAALHVRFNRKSVTIRNCVFSRNSAESMEGSIVFLEADTAFVRDCVFRENRCVRGTVLFGGRDTLAVERCAFVANAMDPVALSLVSAGNRASYTECVFEENGGDDTQAPYPSSAGSLLWLNRDLTSVIVDRCRFTRNRMESAIAVSGDLLRRLAITECVFEDNVGYELPGSYRAPAGSILSFGSRLHVEQNGDTWTFIDDKPIIRAVIDRCQFTGNRIESIVAVGSDSLCQISVRSSRFLRNHVSDVVTVSGEQEYSTFPVTRRRPVVSIGDCIVAGNYSEENLPGIGIWDAYFDIRNCTVVRNRYVDTWRWSPPDAAVGLGNADGRVVNTVIRDNRGYFYPGIHRSWGIASDAGAVVRYCNIDSTGYPGEGNMNADPLFADTLTYALLLGSPCIDAGDPSFPRDIDGSRVDIGASANLSPGAITAIREGHPRAFALAQNAPNPFNPSTVISFSLAQPGEAQLAIYNIYGQLVRTLVDGPRMAGAHEVVWNGRDTGGRPVGSGVYLYRLVAQEGVAVRRMVLVR